MISRFFLLALLAGGLSTALADNAVPIAERDSGNVRILFFAHESPLRAGLLKLSVMLLDASSSRPLTDWQMHSVVRPVSLESGARKAWVAPSCRMTPRGDLNAALPLNFAGGGETNFLAREASVILLEPGTWRVGATFAMPDGKRHQVEIDLNIVSARPPLLRYWPWFAVLPVFVLGYAWSRPA